MLTRIASKKPKARNLKGATSLIMYPYYSNNFDENKAFIDKAMEVKTERIASEKQKLTIRKITYPYVSEWLWCIIFFQTGYSVTNSAAMI